MTVYKGTDKDIKCRGYQFTPGVEAVEDRAELCEAGFHACEAPLDVLGYYPPGAGSRYFEAELEDVSPERHDSDSKVVGKRITLGAEIGIPGLIKAQIEYVKSTISKEGEKKDAASGDGSNLAASGNGSNLAASGNGCVAAGLGAENRAKATVGSWIVLAEYGEYNGKYRPCTCVKSAQIDGETLKPDTWYKLENGEFVEVSEDE